MANLVAEEMERRGVHFIYQAKPSKVEKQSDGRRLVHWVDKVCFKNRFTRNNVHVKQYSSHFFFFLEWSSSSRCF